MGNALQCRESEHLAISTRKSDITSPHVTMNGTQIPQVASHKHLGVNINNTLSRHQHVDKVYTSCARRIGMIRRLRRKLPPGCSEVNLGYVHTYTFSKRSVFEKIRFGVSTRIVRQSGDPVHTDVD